VPILAESSRTAREIHIEVQARTFENPFYKWCVIIFDLGCRCQSPTGKPQPTNDTFR
jgi:hypothetical protein